MTSCCVAGAGGYGQLGTGTSTPSSIPLAVTGGFAFSELATGSTHACGLLANGSALCWGGCIRHASVSGKFAPQPLVNGPVHFLMPAGSGDSGELGTGGTSQSNIPVAVSGGLTFSHIAAGTSYSCGVLVNGSAFCWGAHSSGRRAARVCLRPSRSLVMGLLHSPMPCRDWRRGTARQRPVRLLTNAHACAWGLHFHASHSKQPVWGILWNSHKHLRPVLGSVCINPCGCSARFVPHASHVAFGQPSVLTSFLPVSCRGWEHWTDGLRSEPDSCHTNSGGWRLFFPDRCHGLTTFVRHCCQLRGALPHSCTTSCTSPAIFVLTARAPARTHVCPDILIIESPANNHAID